MHTFWTPALNQQLRSTYPGAAGKQMEQSQVCGAGSPNKPPHSQGQQLVKYIREHICHILRQYLGTENNGGWDLF